MGKRREFRFSKGGYSLYALLDESEQGGGVRYLVVDPANELMDELPSLGQASALMDQLAQSARRAEGGLPA